MPASYPSAIKTFTTKTNKVDLVDAAHINDLQLEVNAIETELGTTVRGTATDLKTRLAVCLDGDGSIRHGISNPGSPLTGQLFIRTDSGVIQFWNGSTWVTAAILSNVIARWMGGTEGGSIGTGEGAYGMDLDGANQAGEYSMRAHNSRNGAFTTIRTIPWTKIAGVNTLTVHARGKASTTDGMYVKVDVGGQNNQGLIVSTSWANVTPFTINVSSLVNGTVYTITISLHNNDAGGANIAEQNLIQYTIEGS